MRGNFDRRLSRIERTMKKRGEAMNIRREIEAIKERAVIVDTKALPMIDYSGPEAWEGELPEPGTLAYQLPSGRNRPAQTIEREPGEGDQAYHARAVKAAQAVFNRGVGVRPLPLLRRIIWEVEA